MRPTHGCDATDIYVIALARDHSSGEIANTGLTGVDEVRLAATVTATGTLALFAGYIDHCCAAGCSETHAKACVASIAGETVPINDILLLRPNFVE